MDSIHSGQAPAPRKKCSVEGCTRYPRSGGVCVGHGAPRKKCSVEGCTRYPRSGGVCVGHGAKSVPEKKRKAPPKCSVEGCTKFSRGADGVCISHGAKSVPKKKCSVEGCTRFSQLGGLCVRHGAKSVPKKKRKPITTEDILDATYKEGQAHRYLNPEIEQDFDAWLAKRKRAWRERWPARPYDAEEPKKKSKRSLPVGVREMRSEQVCYTDEFFKYAACYGEPAARQCYGAWSPPEGTPNPYGNASPEAAAAAKVAAEKQRQAAEKKRQAAEKKRQAAEKKRQAAEKKRQEHVSTKACCPHNPPSQAAAKCYQGEDMATMMLTEVPMFQHIINYPTLKQPATDDTKRGCVMCGRCCLKSATKKGNRSGGEQGCNIAEENQRKPTVIPNQNKGICTECDVIVWVHSASGLQIKWCKGCKNFKTWASWGRKGHVTKCLQCRDQNNARYAKAKADKAEKQNSLK